MFNNSALIFRRLALAAVLAVVSFACAAQTPMPLLGVGSGSAGGVPSFVSALTSQAGTAPDQTCNFAISICWTPSGGSQDSAAALTVSRASPETCADTRGNYIQVTNNVPCITNAGLGAWEARTNSIRTSDTTGATPGLLSTVGTLPNNWSMGFGTTGLTNANITVGTVSTMSGLLVLPLTIVGTPTATTELGVVIEDAAASLYGQTWTGSVFDAATGTFGNTRIEVDELTSVGGLLAGNLSTSRTPTASLFRSTLNYANVSATTARQRIQYRIVTTNGVPINGTYYIALPQLENNNINSSVASGAQTVTNSGTSTCVSGTYTVVGGTGTAATLTGVASAGVITTLTTLTGGSYTVFPPSPAALTGTGCSGSPTATLTPINNAALAFATPPIVTTSGAVARALDNILLANPPIPTTATSVLFTANQQAGSAVATASAGGYTDGFGSNANSVWGYHSTAPSTTFTPVRVVNSGAGTDCTVATTITLPSSYRLAFRAAANDFSGVLNGGTPCTTAQPFPSGMNTFYVGSINSRMLNGSMLGEAIWNNRGLPNATLQGLNINYLLRRDLGPANDNSPMYLDAAA